jgi:uncharacterized membrane protein YuzA (DUF378 family)|tara:strand:+ start:478 stop:645 length:168 start_codon:yes stop_codon:yes gene_type:complete
MSNQGKDKQNYENSAKVAWYAIIGLTALLVLMTLFGGCSTTKKVDECCSSKTVVE